MAGVWPWLGASNRGGAASMSLIEIFAVGALCIAAWKVIA